mgnify:CR=1 FL=1
MTGCDTLPIRLQQIYGATVDINLFINHETHWMYFSLDGPWSGFTIDIMNELTVTLREKYHIIVKNLAIVSTGDHHTTISFCIYFEQDNNEVEQSISRAARLPMLIPTIV